MEPMDPNTREPEDQGQDGDGRAPGRRPPRDSLAADFPPLAPAPVRTVQLVAGDFLLTVNPVDGSEIESCPPGERVGRASRYTVDARAEADRATRPPAPPGPARPAPPLLGRREERERLVRLLARGRCVRLTGAPGSGRTSLLDVVAEDCADFAPDGVVRLSGYRRTAEDLLHDLFHAVYDAPRYRPGREELLEHVREIGAIVVVDDLEFGGSALDELLDATPECAFLMAATPDVPAASAEFEVEEIVLGGLGRADGIALVEQGVGRPLTEEEANWAGDVWFESEGLPLRFVQAGALLRQRDRLRADADAVEEFGVFADTSAADGPVDGTGEGGDGAQLPLPSLGEAAGPAPLLASRLSASARAALRFAVALGGEVPHPAHLPALVGDTHADAALGELVACGLVSPVGCRYRLAAGVLTQLQAAGYGDDGEETARAAARHYTWWAGHPSVGAERVCAEADAVLAALAVLVPTAGPGEDGEASPAVRLARAAAPAFAAGGDWGAWERALRFGAEASRLAGEVAGQAYFHHELGILALCGGLLDRARAELEASIGLRGAVADKRGTVAGRRALALVEDRSGTASGPDAVPVPGLGGAPAAEEVPDARTEESATPPDAVTTPFPKLKPPVGDTATLVSYQPPNAAPPGAARPAAAPAAKRTGIKAFARRNLVAAGAGAVLAAVLGTVVTLGATSHNDPDTPSDKVGVNPSASQGADDGSLGADTPPQDGGPGGGAVPADGSVGTATGRPTDPGPDGTVGTADDPAPTRGGAGPSDTIEPTGGGTSSGTSPDPTGSSGSAGGSHTGGSSGGTGSQTGGSSGSGSPTGGGSGDPATGGGSGESGGSGDPATGGGSGESGGSGDPTTGGGSGESGGSGDPTTGGGSGESGGSGDATGGGSSPTSGVSAGVTSTSTSANSPAAPSGTATAA
jgi:hypothetical protein